MFYNDQVTSRLLAALLSATLAMLTVVAATDTAHARPQHHPNRIDANDADSSTEAVRVVARGGDRVGVQSHRRGPAHHKTDKVPRCMAVYSMLASVADTRG